MSVGPIVSIIILLLAMSVVEAADARQFYMTGLGSGIVGIVILFFARLPLYREGRFFIFGPRALDRKHRRLYWLAYVFVAASLLLFLVVRAGR